MSNERPSHTKKARNVVALSGGALVVAAPLLTSGTADASTYTVTNLDDAGAGSLRQAIDDANNHSGADTITFQAGLTGTIAAITRMDIRDDTTLQGPGASVIAVDGGDATDLFYVGAVGRSIDVTISGLTISNGSSAGGGNGIFNAGERLVLDSVTMSGNEGTYGGALYSQISAEQTLTIRNSTFSGNTSTNRAGAIYIGGTATSSDPVVVIEDSTFSGNTALSARGGAVYLYNPKGPVRITNSTFTGNTATAGGALYVRNAGPDFVIAHTTISGNTAVDAGGGAAYLYTGTIILENTIVAGNSAADGRGDDLAGSGTFAAEYSIIGELDDPIVVTGTTNISSTNPMLGALADNDGATQTMLPLDGSPAIDAGDPAFVAPPAEDQRGKSRVLGGRTDIGAVEVEPDLPPTGGSNGLMAGIGAALLGLGGVLHLSGRRTRATTR